MKTLWIDTSSYYLYVGLTDATLLFHEQLRGKNNHSENLLDTVKRALGSTSWTPNMLERIVVGIGPGSYTGLRVALTVAKTLAWTLHIPLYTISSLDFALSGYLHEPGCYLVKMHAKKDYHFIKVVQIGSSYEVIHGDRYVEDGVMHEIQESFDCPIVIDEDQYRYSPMDVGEELLHKVEDIYLLEPDYLRGEA